MKPPTFVVADDDAGIRDLLVRLLESGFPGAAVVPLSDPDRVVGVCAEVRPDLVFLDWVFGGGRTGPTVCARLKRHPATRRIPVILMTGQRTDLASRFKSVKSGADLFLQKPFTVEEASGYATALLGKSVGAAEDVLRCGSLTLRREGRSARLGARALPVLPPQLFALLWYLAKRAPAAVCSEELLRYAWKKPVRDRYVKVAVDRLRGKLAAYPGLLIETVPHAGYRLIA